MRGRFGGQQRVPETYPSVGSNRDVWRLFSAFSHWPIRSCTMQAICVSVKKARSDPGQCLNSDYSRDPIEHHWRDGFQMVLVLGNCNLWMDRPSCPAIRRSRSPNDEFYPRRISSDLTLALAWPSRDLCTPDAHSIVLVFFWPGVLCCCLSLSLFISLFIINNTANARRASGE